MPPIWEQATGFFKSWFDYPGLTPVTALISIALAFGFGAIWLVLHRPPLFKRPWLWVVGVFSALFTLAAAAFIQIPSQMWVGFRMLDIFSDETLMNWLLAAALPQIILSGLVQEGAKMVPIVGWWWRSGRSISPRLGMGIGAIAGAGFGIFEAVWIHNRVLTAGWTWDMVSQGGYMGLLPFWERFFVVGFHIATSALMGWGLARGKGWQFFLIASGAHALLNYSDILLQRGYLTIGWLEIFAATIAVIFTAWAVWLRWKRTDDLEDAVPPYEAAAVTAAAPVDVSPPADAADKPGS